LYAQSIKRRLEESPGSADFLADLLRIGREDAGLSVRELARRSGVDAMYLSRMERGLIREKDWSKIAAILGQLPVSEFAKQAELSGAVQLRNSALQMAADLEKLLSSLPKATLSDKEWISVIEDRLRRCMLILNVSEKGSIG
jgi:transcriptional regulator with XRE-family HTH domain